MRCSKCFHDLDGKSLVCPVCGNYNLFEFNSDTQVDSTDNEVKEPLLVEKPIENLEDPKDYTPSELMEEIRDLMDKTITEPKTPPTPTEQVPLSTISDNVDATEPFEENKDLDKTIIEHPEPKETTKIISPSIQKAEGTEPIEEINQSIEDIMVKPEEYVTDLDNNELKDTGFFKNYLIQKKNQQFKNNDSFKRENYFSYRWLMTVLFLIIIVIGFAAIYLSYMSPKAVYKKTQKQLYNFVANNFNQDISTVSGNLNGYLIISNNIKSAPINWQFDTKYGIDYQTRTANITLKTNQDYKELTNINYYLEDGYSYINIGDKFNQYVTEPYENFEQTISLKNDIATINEAVNKAFRKSIKNKYISESKSTIEEEYQEQTSINVLTLNYNDFMDDFLTNLQKNQDFINTYSRLKNIGPDEAENIIQAEINRNRKITFELYTKGLLNEVVGLKISVKNENNYILEVIKRNDQRYVFTYKDSDLKQPLTGEIILNKMREWFDIKLEASDQKNIELLANINFRNTYNKPIKRTNIDNYIKRVELPDDKIIIYQDELEKNKSIFNYGYIKKILK